ncbi:hypothetical protein [Evansella clarkii]|nr:hypothetical protein [Evansella clarkii]
MITISATILARLFEEHILSGKMKINQNAAGLNLKKKAYSSYRGK